MLCDRLSKSAPTLLHTHVTRVKHTVSQGSLTLEHFSRVHANLRTTHAPLGRPWRDDAPSLACAVRVAPPERLSSAAPKPRPPHQRSPCVFRSRVQARPRLEQRLLQAKMLRAHHGACGARARVHFPTPCPARFAPCPPRIHPHCCLSSLLSRCSNVCLVTLPFAFVHIHARRRSIALVFSSSSLAAASICRRNSSASARSASISGTDLVCIKFLGLVPQSLEGRRVPGLRFGPASVPLQPLHLRC